MNQRFEDAHLNEVKEELKQKYYNKRRKVPLLEDLSPGTSDAAQRFMLTESNNHSNNNPICSSEALQDLFKAVSNNLDHGSENLRGNSPTVAHHDSLLFTETDVTLPSCLDGSLDSVETETDQMLQRPHHFSDFCGSSSFELTKIHHEMTTICEQLKEERQSQQEWERVLLTRERKLEQREEALGMNGLEQMVHTRVVAIEEKHQRELSQLQELLRVKSRENKRLKSSFDTIKELNDNLKTQLNKISEQKKTLESESKRVWARLENLQKKHSTASKDHQKVIPKRSESSKPDKKEKTAADAIRRRGQKNNLNPSPKLLMLLLDWVLDVQTISPEKTKVFVQCLPPEAQLSERCIKVLPLLADQLHQTPSSEPGLLLNLLRLIYWALRHLDNSTHHVPLSATLRRIGEEASKPASQCITSQSEDPHLPIETSGCLRSWPLYQSPCPQTHILSTLIILRTITQADILALVLENLRTGLMCEENRGLYVHYEGVSVLLSLIRANRVGLHMPVDILVQLTQHSRFLNPFLEACSCEEFFKTASQMLKSARLEPSSLEKFSMLLQKLSSIRKNRQLFELSSLHLQIQELHHKTNPTHTFLCLNLRSILLNLA